MAFAQNELSLMAYTGTSGGNHFFFYRNSEDDDVTAAGFFDTLLAAPGRVSDGDLLFDVGGKRLCVLNIGDDGGTPIVEVTVVGEEGG